MARDPRIPPPPTRYGPAKPAQPSVRPMARFVPPPPALGAVLAKTRLPSLAAPGADVAQPAGGAGALVGLAVATWPYSLVVGAITVGLMVAGYHYLGGEPAHHAGNGPANGGNRRQRRRHLAPAAPAAHAAVVHAPAVHAPAPPVVLACNVGDYIELDDVPDARRIIAQQNHQARQALQAAVVLTAPYEALRARYHHDRDHNYVPNNGGGHVHLVLVHGRDQAYANAQNYFPAAHGVTYRELDINPGVGVAGNYRLIRASAPIGNYQEWAGFNITHPGAMWIRVWNRAHNYWQDWNVANAMAHRAADLPNHAAAAPVDPRTAGQRAMVQHGITIKSLVNEGFLVRVRGVVEMPA